MMDIDLERERMDLYDGKGGDLPADRVPSAKQVLEDLVSSDESTLEGLTVHLKEEQEEDGEGGDGGDGGGGGFQHLDLLATNLAQLVNLIQLAIQSYGGIFAESYFREEHLADTARFLATSVSSLRYIKVCQLYWRIWRYEKDIERRPRRKCSTGIVGRRRSQKLNFFVIRFGNRMKSRHVIL